MKIKSNEQRLIYKIGSGLLAKNGYNLNLPLEVAMRDYPEYIVAIADSQIQRWINEINGITDINKDIRHLKNKIRRLRRKEKYAKNKAAIRKLYTELYNLQFQKDYVCVVMEGNRLNCQKAYDKVNNGFTINGIQYRRLLGTNGGIKNNTIVYVNINIYDELKKRIDNGRNKEIPLVPAKLEAYQALTCSGSTPIPAPNGIIVVKDCITHFTEDVITITDSADEPLLEHKSGYELEHNNSDGYGLMLPSYSARVNEYLTGNATPISGMNTRYSFEKGMVYTFDFVEFAEKVAGTYEVTDVWGDKRDIRDAEVILTESMLKLWDSYDSWEDYYKNCKENHYQFSTPKTTPETLENVRNTNYQFLQSYQFTDEELQELCQPTVDEVKDIMGLDYRKTIVYLTGGNVDLDKQEDDHIKALMIDPQMINDPYVISQIYSNISKRMDNAKKGTIKVKGNYQMISGDPYALMQSIFGLPVTGLLKAGEIYSKYWIDNGDDYVVCFRAPMSAYNNIRKMRLNKSDDAAYWFRYITTALILNAWDSTCDALSGADFDGDTCMTTNNPVLLNNTIKTPAIICMQRKAAKIIPTEDDIIESNKLAFNDEIGTVTNRVTSMYEVQAGFEPGTQEYETLAYRIMCGQHLQQETIDRCKGIITKPMPESWYKVKKPKDDKDAELTDFYTPLEIAIVADKKPYFMKYIYPAEKSKYDTYIRDSNRGSILRYGVDIEKLKQTEQTDEIKTCLDWYNKRMPLGTNPCTMNKMCWFFESAFADVKQLTSGDFDYTILKSNTPYTVKEKNDIADIYKSYQTRVADFVKRSKTERIDKDDADIAKQLFINDFIAQCAVAVPNILALTDIVLDLCYTSNKSKAFAWEICGNQIIDNLLNSHNRLINIPILDANGDFEVGGETYKMFNKRMEKYENENYTE